MALGSKAAPAPRPAASPIPLTKQPTSAGAPIPLTRAPAAAPIPLATKAPSRAAPCVSCGAEIPSGFRFCGACGAPAPGAQAQAAVVRAPPAPTLRAQIVVVAPDGSDAGAWSLSRPVRVGRTQGDITFPDDVHISEPHCHFEARGDKVYVVDDGSVNGVFVALRREMELPMGGEIRLGRQVVRLEPMPEPAETGGAPVWGSPDPGYVARLVQQFEDGGDGDIYPLREGDNAVGRGAGDVTFPKDGYVSSRHGVVTVKNGRVTVKDIGSANGTFLKIIGEGALENGDLILMGDQLLRVDIG